MKIKLVVVFIPALLIFCSPAHAQTAGGLLSNSPVILELPSHPELAQLHDMAPEHELVGQGPNTYSYAQGEQPLWEFGHPYEAVPLGDVARAYRQQKLTAKKAQIVLEEQGEETKTR
jgi:hypothetical protein